MVEILISQPVFKHATGGLLLGTFVLVFAVLYIAAIGNFEEAGKHLEFAAGSRFQMCRVLARAYHAMAAHHFGQPEDAAWLLKTATEEMEPLSADDPAIYWYDEIFARVALKEARDLIAGQAE